MNSLHLYIHLPFCAGKCRYCDFYSIDCPSASGIDRYLAALAREWELVRHAAGIAATAVETVYVGGGTPSVLSIRQWRELCAALGPIAPAEWTVECNPESFHAEKARVWAATGVNRLSVGVQSLDERMLRFLGRRHTAAGVARVLADPALGAFDSVGVDLMYGLPGQCPSDLVTTVERLLDGTPVAHISAYELTLSDHSRLGRHRGLLPLPDDTGVADMYQAIEQRLEAAGFEHYEVSNYARPGHYSRHNRAYWRHAAYVGLGAAAHSFLPPHRRANVADVRAYEEALEQGRLPVAFSERLCRDDLVHEALMLGLRTAEGIDRERFRALTGEELAAPSRAQRLSCLVAEGLLRIDGARYVPTRDGMPRADGLARYLS